MTAQLRPYAPADAPAVVELVNADALATIGARRAVVDGVGAVRLSRFVPADAERVVACAADGRVVGYAYLGGGEPAIVVETGGAVAPDRHGHGIGGALVRWAVDRAAIWATPDGVRQVLQVVLGDEQRAAADLYRANGFRPVRQWLHMVVDLTAAPEASRLPSGLELRPMDLDADWDAVGPAMDEAFTDHWGAITESFDENSDEDEADDEEVPADDSYSNAPGLCWLAWDGDVVAGGVLGNATLVERSDTGRLGSLFVRPAYRNRGLGRALGLALLGACWQRGLRRVVTDTDAASFSDTPRFYARLGLREYRRESTYEKVLRDGREVRRLDR